MTRGDMIGLTVLELDTQMPTKLPTFEEGYFAPTLHLVDPAVGPTWGDLKPLQTWLIERASLTQPPACSAAAASAMAISRAAPGRSGVPARLSGWAPAHKPVPA